MSTALEKYLVSVDPAAPPTSYATLDEFTQAIVVFQRTGNSMLARLALEAAELDEAHADEAARLQQLDHVERGKGDQPRLFDALDTATQRTRFLQEKWGEVTKLLTGLRTGTNDLRDDQRRLRTLSQPSQEIPT